jgi:hypothetical protein
MVTALAPRSEIGHNGCMKLRFFALLLAVPVAACSVPIVPEGTRAPAPKPAIPAPAAKPDAPMAAGTWTDWPITPGDWVYRSDDRGSIALFGPSGRDAIVTLRCDRARGRLFFSRAAQVADGGGTMTIRSSSAMKQFTAQPSGGNPAYLAVEIAPSDSFLDAIVFTRGRIAVEAAGQPRIAIPVWAEIGKIVEDCRT